LLNTRRERQLKTAQTIGGSAENDTGAGPPHWYENYNATNSRAWMISDPEDGKIPALTDEARKRAAAVRAAAAAATATTPVRSTIRRTFGMRLTKDDSHVFEYACHEGNEGLRGSSARHAPRSAKAAAASNV
jgi:hypothetical protein